MDVKNERNHVFNIRLAKLMGIYHILDPGTLKYRGLNVYQIALAFNLLYMGVTSIMMNVIGVNCWTVNLLLSVDFFWKADSMLYLIYKWFILIRYSDAVWNCLSITRYDFTSLRSRNIQTLDRWRRRSVRFTNVLTWLCISSIFFYLFLSMIFSKDKLLVKNLDGSIGNYRQSVMNFYFIVSDETYNTQYKTFYFIESIYLTISTLIFLAFDVLLISLVFAFCCQMKMVCSTFESLGHKSLHDNHTSIDYKDGNSKIPNIHDLVYDELKTIIMDHQAIMEKFEDFLNIYKRIMLPQIFISSIQQICLWFFFIMSFSDDARFSASDSLVKQIGQSALIFSVQIFIACYVFGNLHDQKDAIIFALYSSNWTEMDMKCKKLILLTMKMNNANQNKLKFTRTKVVNLEMYFQTMGHCYSVISVLLNYIKK